MIALSTPWAGLTVASAFCLSISVPGLVQVQTAGSLHSSSVSGTVTAEDIPTRPVRRAIVTIRGDLLPDGLSTVADDNGQFSIDGIPAGRYSLSASRAGMLSVPYGATGPARPGRSVVLTSGQRVSGLDLRLVPGAVVSGTVRTAEGRPLQGVQVAILRRQRAGDWTVVPPLLRTDSAGRYRGFGLPEGECLVLARFTGAASQPRLTPSDSEMQAELDALAGGRVGGRSAPGTPMVFHPVLYPGVSTVAEAVRVYLEAGRESAGIDVSMRAVQTSGVEGTLVAPSAEDLTSVDVTLVGEDALGIPPATVAAHQGEFRFDGVSPGRYRVEARTRGFTGQARSGDSSRATLVRPTMWADAEVSVTTGGARRVTLDLRPTVVLRGQVLFSGAEEPPPVELVQVAAQPRRTRQAATGLARSVQPVTASIKPDGQFEIQGLVPGEYRLTAAVSSRPGVHGWFLRAIEFDAQDVLDGWFSLTGAQATTTLLIRFSDRSSGVVGRLVLPTGLPALDYSIVAFTVDRRWWGKGSRRVASSVPAANGEYRFGDLPPGRYYVAALADVTLSDLDDPEFLERISAWSVSIVVTEGQDTELNLRVVDRTGLVAALQDDGDEHR